MEKMFDEYCQKHIKGPDVYCEKVNMNCPPAFCHFVCWGDWKKHRKMNTEELRAKHFKPATEEEKANKELVSVIIPYKPEDAKYLEKTISSIKETAAGPIEIFDVCDDNFKGQRKIINECARKAEGKYLFRLDAHCKMTPEWDVKMKALCGEGTIVTTIFDDLDTETWQGKGKDVAFVRINTEMMARFVRGWKTIEEREIEEETMGISGTAFMILKDYYWKLGGCDESLGEYGGIGSEWSCKVWLTGGSCLIRTDVVCYHLFRKLTPFDVDRAAETAAYEKLKEQWLVGKDERITRPFGWLVYRFSKYVKNRMPNYI